MGKIVFFLEGLSEKKMLHGLLPRIVPTGISWQLIPFQGKSDLEKQLPLKLRAWREPDTFFIVLRDKDCEDCLHVKERLCTICKSSGRTNWLVRIACHELESWYLGDLTAVETAFQKKGLAANQIRAKFKDPDNIQNPSEELRKLTENNYFKITGSWKIGQHLSTTGNRSKSFRNFISGINKACFSFSAGFREES